MEDNKIIKVAAISFIGLVAVPAVIGATIKLGCIVANGINHLAYKMKIKKGLKEGSIIEIDGQYYEVEVEKQKTNNRSERRLMLLSFCSRKLRILL